MSDFAADLAADPLLPPDVPVVYLFWKTVKLCRA